MVEYFSDMKSYLLKEPACSTAEMLLVSQYIYIYILSEGGPEARLPATLAPGIELRLLKQPRRSGRCQLQDSTGLSGSTGLSVPSFLGDSLPSRLSPHLLC